MGEMEVQLHSVPERESAPDEALSFEAFVETESARLFRALFLVTGDRHEAEEVMQDAFLRIWERWDRVGGLEDPTGYLFRTALNQFRTRRRRAGLALRRTVALAPAGDDFAQVEARDVVFRALRGLSPKQRAAIVVTALLGYGSDEAGAMLGMSAATVRMHASRARAQMKKTVGEQP